MKRVTTIRVFTRNHPVGRRACLGNRNSHGKRARTAENDDKKQGQTALSTTNDPSRNKKRTISCNTARESAEQTWEGTLLEPVSQPRREATTNPTTGCVCKTRGSTKDGLIERSLLLDSSFVRLFIGVLCATQQREATTTRNAGRKKVV